MATVLRVTSGPYDADDRANIAPVLVLNVAFGLALVGVVYAFAARLAGPWPAFVLCCGGDQQVHPRGDGRS